MSKCRKNPKYDIMKYTKSDLQLSSEALFNTIIQVGKELEKSDTPRSRALNKKLLSNFKNYDKTQITKMFNDFQRFFVDSVNEKGVLDVEYMIRDNISGLKEIIQLEP
tara:strand:- start:4822 stop:5145 length:324 start_codon:yes stop_codon:yes gene_type:complete